MFHCYGVHSQWSHFMPFDLKKKSSSELKTRNLDLLMHILDYVSVVL